MDLCKLERLRFHLALLSDKLLVLVCLPVFESLSTRGGIGVILYLNSSFVEVES